MAEAEQTELILFIENDSRLWGPSPSRGDSIRKNIARKIKSGTLDPARVADLFAYLMDDGAKKYAKEYGGTWNQLFTKKDREEAAKTMSENYLEELKVQGEWDGKAGPGAPSPKARQKPGRVLSREGASTKVKSIHIVGRRWFQKSFGNTYFTYIIYVDGGRVGYGKTIKENDPQYGYGDHYITVALQKLVQEGYLPKAPATQTTNRWYSLRQVREETGIDITADVEDVPRKRDLKFS